MLEPQAGQISPASPCSGVCRLDDAGFCLGCRRSLTEIAAWSSMSVGEQHAVLAQLPARKITKQEVTNVDVMSRIKEQVGSNPIMLYMKGTPDFPQCGFSARAVQLLRNAGASEFAAVNVLEDAEIRDGIKQFGNWPTIPQLYIRGELVGGSDILAELHASGELQKLIAGAKAAD